MAGFSNLTARSEQIVLEANTDYWDRDRLPRLKRIVFDNTIGQQDAIELVKTTEGRVDVVNGLRPLETLQVAQSPFAKVVKKRRALVTVFGQFNMRKANSPWNDVRLRQAANLAIHRENFIRYATKGNGVIIPALIPEAAFGYDPDLTPYPFDPERARQLLREAGYPNGLALSLIAPTDLEVQATVVSKMLEHAGFTVELQMLDAATFHRKTDLSTLDQPPAQQPWDMALWSFLDFLNFPAFLLYHYFILDGPSDWTMEQPELRQLWEQVLNTVTDRTHQEALIRQMERHTYDQAYLLFLYSPIQLYAVNQAVEFVPHVNTLFMLDKTSVTDQHWSVRKQKAAMPE